MTEVDLAATHSSLANVITLSVARLELEAAKITDDIGIDGLNPESKKNLSDLVKLITELKELAASFGSIQFQQSSCTLTHARSQ